MISAPTIVDASERQDVFVLTARCTLVVSLVNGRHSLPALAVTALVTLVCFLEPPRLRSTLPWAILTVVHGTAQAVEWWRIDDHVVAGTWWLLALGLVTRSARPERTLALTARLLVGTIFALALGWKVLSSQYTSGEFWRYTLVRDDRIAWVADHVAGTEDLDAQRLEIALLGPGEPSLVVDDGPRAPLVAAVLTWWGIAIEGALAAVFLVPLRGGARVARGITMMVFCATTYVLIPVVGFATLLMTMSLPTHGDRRVRTASIALAVALMVWAAVFDLVVP